MKTIDFIKYEGLGNDFVLFDDLDERLELGSATIASICDRHFGVGADGVIVVRPSDAADARMIFYNPDGSQARMCGNGVRAFAKYLFDNGLVRETSITVETDAGVKKIDVTLEGGKVAAARVDMGTPSFASADVPIDLPTVEAVNFPIEVADRVVTATCLSMGNPHCVIFVEDIDKAPVDTVGSALERHEIFPERANIEFAQVIRRDLIDLRVWERGAGETLACGTGACAAAVAAARTGRTDRRLRVQLPGGSLQISWEGDGRVMMTGPAREVFRGTIDIEAVSAE